MAAAIATAIAAIAIATTIAVMPMVTPSTGVRPACRSDTAAAVWVRRACAALPHVEFIVQRNKQTRPLWERLLADPPDNLSMLFDDSMGLGVSTTSWPAPPPIDGALRFGYAGGLSPNNLAEQIGLMEQTAPVRELSRLNTA